MKSVSTAVLRSALLLIGAIVAAICIVGLPQAIYGELKGDFDYLPIMIGLYVPAVPFFIALFQSWKILGYIDRNKAFTRHSVKSFRIIRNCALIISGVFIVGMPYIFYVADQDDAPGLVALGLVIIGASFVIGTFAALLQKLIQNALDIKSENDLTV